MDWDILNKKLADGLRISDEDIARLADQFRQARRAISKLRSNRRADETKEISPEEREPFVLLVERLDDTAPESGERELVMRRLDDELQNLCRGRSLISPITHESKQAIAVALEEVIFSCEDAEEEGEGMDYVLSRLKTFRLIAESKPAETEAEPNAPGAGKPFSKMTPEEQTDYASDAEADAEGPAREAINKEASEAAALESADDE